jgi:hypothetical protein
MQGTTQSRIEFNSVNQKQLSLLLVPGEYLIPFGVIGGIGAMILYVLATLRLYDHWQWAFVVAAIGTYWVVVGKNGYQYFSKFFKPHKAVVTNALDYRTPQRLKRTIGKVKVISRTTQKKETFTAAEDLIDLAEMLRFKLRRQDGGAYVLEDPRGGHIVVWCFEAKGIPYTLREEEYRAIATDIELALKDFSLNGGVETITLQASVMASSSEQEEKIQQLSATAPTEQDRFLLEWQRRRIARMAELGRHCPRNLRIFCTTRLDLASAQVGEANPLEVLIQKVENLFPKAYAGDRLKQDLELMLRDAFERGFLPYLDFLQDRMKFTVKVPTWKQAWQWAWEKVNDGNAPAPNSLMVLTETSFVIKNNGGPSLASTLFQAGQPFFDNAYVYLPGKKQYVAGVVLCAPPKRSWGANERKDQLFYGSECLNNSKTANIEVICQFSTIPQWKSEFTAMMRTRQANSWQIYNKDRQRSDVGSDLIYEDSIKSEKALKRGEVHIQVGWMAQVYRKTPKALNQAVKQFCGLPCFSGQIAKREIGYFSQLWLDALPFTKAAILAADGINFGRFERRITDGVKPVVGLLPLLKENSYHERGLELITPNRNPLFIDPLAKDPHNHMIVLGFIGAGKSMILQSLAQYAKSRRAKVIIVDSTRGDGTGSYDAWVKFMGGAYFNSTKDASNLLEGFDFRAYTEGTEQYRFAIETFVNFLQQSLTDLSYLGSDESRKAKVKNIHTFVIDRFLKDAAIQERRDLAFDGGMGSDAWSDFPTLVDYLDFMVPENLVPSARTAEYLLLLDEAKAELSALLLRPAGKAISRPSTFDGNAPLLVYGLGGITSDEQAKPLIIGAQANVLAQALKPGDVFFVLEEASYALKFPSIGVFAADMWAKGRKLDVWACMVGQTLEPIERSIACDDVLKNTNTFITGFIKTEAIPGLVKRGIPEDLLRECARMEFFRPKDEFARRFLVSQGDLHTFADHYVDFASFVMTMNEGREIEMRDEYLGQYSNSYQAYSMLANEVRKRSIDYEEG